MLDLVGNPEDRFSQGAVHIMPCSNFMFFQSSRVTHMDIRCLANLSSTSLPISTMTSTYDIDKRGLTGRAKEKTAIQ